MVKSKRIKHGGNLGIRRGIRGSYISMRNRCLVFSHGAYNNYGGRGIIICNEWLYSYDAFRKWAEQNGYSYGLTLDRINNNGNYEPSNCRWVSYKEQSRNRRTTILYNGMTAKEASYKLGGCEGLVSYRIRHGWSFEKAFTTKAKIYLY